MSEARVFAAEMVGGLGFNYDLEKLVRLSKLGGNPYYDLLNNEIEVHYLGPTPMWVQEQITEMLKTSLESTDFRYIIGHTLRVRNMAMAICPESVDKQAVELAALFHDISKFRGEAVHSEQGARIARGWLLKNGFQAELVSKVSKAILTHMYGPTTPEGQVLYDADRLDKIGITGVALLIIKAYQKGVSISELRDLYLSNSPEWIQDKHKPSPASFSFSQSRELATQRVKLMDQFFQELSQNPE